MNFKKWLWVNKEGMILGGALAAFLAWRGWTLPVKGFDSPILMITIFVIIGGLIDSLIEPNK